MNTPVHKQMYCYLSAADCLLIMAKKAIQSYYTIVAFQSANDFLHGFQRNRFYLEKGTIGLIHKMTDMILILQQDELPFCLNCIAVGMKQSDIWYPEGVQTLQSRWQSRTTSSKQTTTEFVSNLRLGSTYFKHINYSLQQTANFGILCYNLSMPKNVQGCLCMMIMMILVCRLLGGLASWLFFLKRMTLNLCTFLHKVATAIDR